jgi:ribosomal protein S18 acetylase RimI-like enzyme
MLIRPATEADAEAAAALWTAAYTARGEGEGRSRPYSTTDFADSARRGEPYLAEEGGEALGIVVFHPPGATGTAIATEGEAELSRLAVAESARRRGVGRALAELCERRARECGADAIVLWSRPYQLAAHRLYESLGYHRAPGRDASDPEGRRVVFTHELGAPGDALQTP